MYSAIETNIIITTFKINVHIIFFFQAYKKVCARGKVCAIQTISLHKSMKFPVCVHQRHVHGKIEDLDLSACALYTHVHAHAYEKIDSQFHVCIKDMFIVRLYI